MGGCVRRVLTYGCSFVHDCFRFSSCADEGRTDYVAILSEAIYTHLAAVFYIYDTIQYFAFVVGADRWRNIMDGFIADITEFPFAGRTFLVYVSFDQFVSFHSCNIAMVEQSYS